MQLCRSPRPMKRNHYLSPNWCVLLPSSRIEYCSIKLVCTQFSIRAVRARLHFRLIFLKAKVCLVKYATGNILKGFIHHFSFSRRMAKGCASVLNTYSVSMLVSSENMSHRYLRVSARKKDSIESSTPISKSVTSRCAP